MNTKTILKKLGFSPTDRVVIFHADDIGMCQASVSAYIDLWEFGLVSAAAAMVPCSWFPAVAQFCRRHPQADMGVHLTLTSEWDTYRWRPLTGGSPAAGLLDKEGYFPRQTAVVQKTAPETAVYRELKAQIEQAIAAGIDVTHIDTHMLAVYPTFINVYLRLADEFGLPAFALQPNAARQIGRPLTKTEAAGRPLLNGWRAMSYEDPANRFEQARYYLDNLPSGITYFLLHPSKDTPELRAIAPDWRIRVADYRLFSSERFRQYVRRSGIQVIGWRVLKELL